MLRSDGCHRDPSRGSASCGLFGSGQSENSGNLNFCSGKIVPALHDPVGMPAGLGSTLWMVVCTTTYLALEPQNFLMAL
jgi:hypothetical protein